MLAQNSGDFPIFWKSRFIKNFIAPAAKRIGVGLFEITTPEIWEANSRRKKLKTCAKDMGTKKVRKPLGGAQNKSKRRTSRKRSVSQKKVGRKTVAFIKLFLTI